MKPDKPIVYNEFYLDAMTGGSPELPAPVTQEQHYLAHLAGMTVTLPQPIILRDMFLAKICGMDVNVPTYIPGKFPRKFAYYAKAAGQDVDVPQPITREEMYWFDYVSGAPSEQEYTGAVPVTFVADGTPLLDYIISGNTVQSATPTPDNPIMPEGTGERTGNLVRFYQEEMQGSFYGVDVTVKNAEITLNGTVTIGSGHWVEIGYKFGGGTESTDNVVIPCEPETPYTIATEILDGNSTQVRIIAFSTSNENRTVNIGSSSTTTFSGDINRIFISLGAEGVVFNNLKFRVMFNKGSTALPYEPYGYKLDISSANTTTPIYLGEVETTRKIMKLVLTGEENIARYNFPNVTRFGARASNTTTIGGLCTHYEWKVLSGGSTDHFYTNNSGDVYIFSTTISTVEDFKSYLAQQYAAGTPVTIWYVLATPETGIVNEPLHKIGDYADTVGMEQTGIEIPTARGTNTLDVLTDVKPSEIYIKYKE